MTENLWPDFDLATKPRTVRRVLIEAGAGLQEKTKGTIRFEVDTAPHGKGGFVHNCYLVAPGLGYRYPLLRVEQGVEPYPVTVYSEQRKGGTPVGSRGQSPEQNERALVEHLREVFKSELTNRIVLQLLDAISDDSSSSSGGEEWDEGASSLGGDEE
jgi:hypothetical protein